jgi:hypothetical protein
MSCFVASIGKLWGDGGLKDLLIESSVYAAGTVEQMMTIAYSCWSNVWIEYACPKEFVIS